ncbi:hypothetical protein CRM22_002831 [Opisthorchis felineus]|uniref:Uncharacterized protein n=1 Tax=Opisthorchis felineus TaxID=147828 RepID=A0A4S2M8Q2_OPIFE|nr:hypothetical protein CRM22_002831 [Opisthorchis felineus]
MTEDQFECLIQTLLPSKVNERPNNYHKVPQFAKSQDDLAMMESNRLSGSSHVEKPGAKKQTVDFTMPPTNAVISTSSVCSFSRSTIVGSATREDTKRSVATQIPLKRTVHPLKPHTKPLLATFNPDWKSQRKFVSVVQNDTPGCLQLNTASNIIIISKYTWKIMGKYAFNPTNRVVLGASGGKLRLPGELICPVLCNNILFTGICNLTNLPHLDLLSLDWIDRLKLI